MKRLALRLCVALATFAIGTTAGKLLPTPFHAQLGQTQAEREVLHVEHEYLDAHLRHDDAALDRILSDDFQFDHPSGYVEGKAQRFALWPTRISPSLPSTRGTLPSTCAATAPLWPARRASTCSEGKSSPASARGTGLHALTSAARAAGKWWPCGPRNSAAARRALSQSKQSYN